VEETSKKSMKLGNIVAVASMIVYERGGHQKNEKATPLTQKRNLNKLFSHLSRKIIHLLEDIYNTSNPTEPK
jgi:hypothetical protein